MSKLQDYEFETFEDPLSNYEPIEYESELHRVLAEDPATEITLDSDLRVEADTPIGEAIQTMHAFQLSCLLVVEEGKLVGIFTERDVLERVSERFPQLRNDPVRSVMTPNPTVVYECDPVGTALAAITDAGHRHVPLLSLDGVPLGILSPRCVLRLLDRYFN